MNSYHYFDTAATTPVYEEALEQLILFNKNEYGNPSSSHALGQRSAQAIRKARLFFSEHFRVEPDQVIFTGSGSESDNLAICGIAMGTLAKKCEEKSPKIICSSIEHAAVKKTVCSLDALGFVTELLKVKSDGQINEEHLKSAITPNTILVSIHRVNNIIGTEYDVEKLATLCKTINPNTIFHSDCVQAFGKVQLPTSNSSVDLVSISAHKIGGPKGVGALIVLNRKLLKSGLRPLIWGGEQEGGFRSGTQNAGLIAAFETASRITLQKQAAFIENTKKLKQRLINKLEEAQLLVKDFHQATKGQAPTGKIVCNSPDSALPHILNFSVPGFPPGPLTKLLEEAKCIVSTGSACSSHKSEPDAVLSAMGLPISIQTSAIRISFSDTHTESEVDHLALSIKNAIQTMTQLFCG